MNKGDEEIDLVHRVLSSFLSELNEQEKSVFGALLFDDREFSLRRAVNASASHVFSERECRILERLCEETGQRSRAQAASMVVVMKATRLCNLRCTYCHAWRDGPGHVMPFEVMARTIRDALVAGGVRHVEFVWHGGEATLLGVRFFENALWLQRHFCPNSVTFSNAIQTNALSVSDEMLAFLKRSNFSVGVSIDGPPHLNDTRRLDKNGQPTSARIARTIRSLQLFDIEFGALAVIDADMAGMPPRVLLEYFVELEVKSIDLLNALPGNDSEACAIASSYLPFPQFVEYLCAVYVEWNSNFKEKIEIRTIRALINKMSGRKHSLCVLSGECQGKYITIESNGDLASCDKYVGDQAYFFGNLNAEPMAGILAASPKLQRARQEHAAYKAASMHCRWYAICNGGCPHDRRMSERFGHTNPTGCCGLSPLLDLISVRSSGDV